MAGWQGVVEERRERHLEHCRVGGSLHAVGRGEVDKLTLRIPALQSKCKAKTRFALLT